MTTILPSDTLFATIRQQGNTVANIKLNGITSMADIVRHIKNSLANLAGLTVIDLRNSSQGWHKRHTIILTTQHDAA